MYLTKDNYAYTLRNGACKSQSPPQWSPMTSICYCTVREVTLSGVYVNICKQDDDIQHMEVELFSQGFRHIRPCTVSLILFFQVYLCQIRTYRVYHCNDRFSWMIDCQIIYSFAQANDSDTFDSRTIQLT